VSVKGRPAQHKPLDVSNGKALFLKGQKVQYKSVTQGTWVDAEVVMVREDGAVMIDLKDRHWFEVADQMAKFRARPRRLFDTGMDVQYFSVTQGGWTDCIVSDYREDGAVQISIKDNYWMKVPEQDEKLRAPCFDRCDELVWEAEKLMRKTPPECHAAEEKYREALQLDPDHVTSMLGLAALLRDYFGELVEAEQLFRAVLEESPFDLTALSDLGDLLKVVGRGEDAKQLHKKWWKVRDRLKELEEDACC